MWCKCLLDWKVPDSHIASLGRCPRVALDLGEDEMPNREAHG